LIEKSIFSADLDFGDEASGGGSRLVWADFEVPSFAILLLLPIVPGDSPPVGVEFDFVSLSRLVPLESLFRRESSVESLLISDGVKIFFVENKYLNLI